MQICLNSMEYNSLLLLLNNLKILKIKVNNKNKNSQWVSKETPRFLNILQIYTKIEKKSTKIASKLDIKYKVYIKNGIKRDLKIKINEN